MSEITLARSQKKYVLAIKRLSTSGSFLTDIAQGVGVSKPTALAAMKDLIQIGAVEKMDTNEYRLTDMGLVAAERLEKENYVLQRVFVDLAGMNRETVEREISQICGVFSKQFVDDLYDIIKKEQGIPMFLDICDIFTPGEYDVPFKIVTEGHGHMHSMGNKGFQHPCCLKINENGNGEILLQSKEIYYKSRIGKTLKGSLKKLYYGKGEAFVSAFNNGENLYSIPLTAIDYKTNEFGKIIYGVLKIKAIATTAHMPAGEAELYLNFELAGKKKNLDESV